MRNKKSLDRWPTVRRLARGAVALAISGALSACGGGSGGGGGGGAPPTPDTLFDPANAWNGSVPADAEMIDADEFLRRASAGELTLVTPDTAKTQEEARRRRFEEDRAFLESLSDRSDDLNALLAEVTAAGGPGGDRVATLPNGEKVTLLDIGTRLSQAADAYRRRRDANVARDAYRMAYTLLPPDLKGQTPDPASLAEAGLDEIDQAARQLDGVLATLADLDNVRIEPNTPAGPARRQSAGNGADNNGVCMPTGYYARYWFPLKKFISPVKNQGERGACWAFAAIAAVESRERVQNDNTFDLSEQFLVNKVKREWDEAEYADGYFSDRALNGAVDRNQPLLAEGGWTYNPATGRPDNAFDADVVGTDDSYRGACNGYTGFCSESAHQSPRSCTNVLGINFCGYNKVHFNGPGIAASRARQVWASGDTFHLDQYRALLAAGYSLIATFPVYEGIRAAPASGIVSNYDKKMRNAKGDLVDGSYGGHVAQIVGFISKEALTFPGSPVTIGGGGYFILRNSWGCGGGDGGYYYVPADYVSGLFSSLEALDFDARRSSRWTAEQIAPGGTEPLQVNGGGTATFDLRVPSFLNGKFTVSHPIAEFVGLSVYSNVDGLLYNGQWPVHSVGFPMSLPVNFATAGVRTLTITARYGGQVVSATKEVVVVNSAPTITLQAAGAPLENETITVSAIVNDINDPDPAPLCAAMQWSIDAPDTIVSGDGCLRTVRFGTQGARQLRVATTDREGAAASAIATYDVGPPPVNPYPRITDAGVYSRDTLFLNGQFAGCRDVRVGNNATIDLREEGCSLFGSITRYWGKVDVENPGNETLSYDWTYSVYLIPGGPPARQSIERTPVPTYEFGALVFGGRDAPYLCDLKVRVNAPDAARSKSQTVWSGNCINVEAAPN